MTITSTCVDTLLINGTDIQNYAALTSAEGLLSNAPQRGDLITQDWTPAAIWQKGPKGSYTFEVPVICRSSQQDIAFGQLRALQAYVGTQVTLTRRLTVAGAVINETCQAVMVNAVQVQWAFERRAQIRAILVFTNLSGDWAPA